MNKIFTLICLGLCPVFTGAQEVTVFRSGEDGYTTYRIPAIVQQKSGALLAFCEGRVANDDDFGNIDIVYKISEDGGKTWGQLRVGIGYDSLQAGNPAPVIDMQDPLYPDGRIFLFYNTGNNSEWSVRNGSAHAFYTDDHGKSFKLSENVPFPGSNETSAAQIGKNSVYLSSRNQRLSPNQRIISVSHDGGQSWISSLPDPNLPDPVNEGSVLSWKKGRRFILAHINAADAAARNNLTLRLSKNKGKTWYFNKLIAQAPAGYKGAYSAYADIVLINKKKAGIIYEKDNYKEIVFAVAAIK